MHSIKATTPHATDHTIRKLRCFMGTRQFPVSGLAGFELENGVGPFAGVAGGGAGTSGAYASLYSFRSWASVSPNLARCSQRFKQASYPAFIPTIRLGLSV